MMYPLTLMLFDAYHQEGRNIVFTIAKCGIGG